MPRVDVVRQYDIDLAEIEREVEAAVGVGLPGEMEKVYTESIRNFEAGSILKGKVLALTPTDVIIDCGYKSEGVIPSDEFDNISRLKVGDEIEVLLETVEDDSGLIKLSKRKADRIRGWERIIAKYKEGDIITGRVTRKIKGGLLVDMGVPIFLPASQIDVKPPGDIAQYIGQEVTCRILKIDETRQNIVVSRRKLIEEDRSKKKQELLSEIAVGQTRKGIVKNIADFGAFIDLGGLDGLLHITDMSWGRISHPSELLAIDDEVEVKILDIDKEKEKVALGLKQKSENPWMNIEEKYPVGSRVKGQVVNIMSYGAFVKLETGIEGLVHISEMSWTRRINHPSEMSWAKKVGHPSEIVKKGDKIEAIVLSVDREKKRVALGLKQLSDDPWTKEIPDKFKVGDIIKGKVTKLTNFGAFLELGRGIEGLLHISEFSNEKVTNPADVVNIDDELEVKVIRIEPDARKIGLSLKKLSDSSTGESQQQPSGEGTDTSEREVSATDA